VKKKGIIFPTEASLGWLVQEFDFMGCGLREFTLKTSCVSKKQS
jgi:hypothetical protein